MSVEQALISGLTALGLNASARQREQWLLHLALLARWNRVHNLTRVADPAQAVTRHLLDSLSIAPFIGPGRVWDIGTGGGFPGLPLAVLFPATEFTLVDKNSKKANFVRQVGIELGLSNVTVLHGRIEQLGAPAAADQIVSRAFAALSAMLDATSALLADGGEWLAMKGRAEPQELAGIDTEQYVMSTHPLTVPGDNAVRHLLRIRRRASSPASSASGS